MKSVPHPLDFQILVQQVQSEIYANHREPDEALRCVIERNDLPDWDGIRLFSAIVNAARDPGSAVRWAA